MGDTVCATSLYPLGITLVHPPHKGAYKHSPEHACQGAAALWARQRTPEHSRRCLANEVESAHDKAYLAAKDHGFESSGREGGGGGKEGKKKKGILK